MKRVFFPRAIETYTVTEIDTIHNEYSESTFDIPSITTRDDGTFESFLLLGAA